MPKFLLNVNPKQPWQVYSKTLKDEQQELVSKCNILCLDPVVQGKYFKKLKVYQKTCLQAQQQFRDDLLTTKVDDLNNKYL